MPGIVSYRILLFVYLFTLFSCTSSESEKNYSDEENKNSKNAGNGCGLPDGSRRATVDYYNPDTEYTSTYSLEVEVEDCEVTTIYFPKGGRLDESHIDAVLLDNNLDATIEDDWGRTYQVHIIDE